MINLQELIAKAKKLPANPEILPKLLNVLQDPESTYWEMSRLINLDQALTSQVLMWSNSGYYGYVVPSVDVEESISRVGTKEIYKLVGLEMGKRLMNSSAKFYALDAGELFESSIAAAFSMEALSIRCGVDPNVAYTVGLLHGIGKLVMDQVFENQYEEVFEYRREKGISLVVAEKEKLGVDHAEVGEALLMKWKFKSEVTEPIGCQYRPKSALAHKNLAYMLGVAHYVVSAIGQGSGRDGMAIDIDPEVLTQLGLSEADLQLLMLETQEKLEMVRFQLLGAKSSTA